MDYVSYVDELVVGINRGTNDRSSRAECLMCLQLHIIDAHNPKKQHKEIRTNQYCPEKMSERQI